MNLLRAHKFTVGRVKELKHNKLKIQEYLLDKTINLEIKYFIFKIRTRMIDVKLNFKSQYLDTKCNFCSEEESQDHLLDCQTIIQHCKELYNDTVVEYEDIFKNAKKQSQMANLFKLAIQTRDQLLLF